MKLPRRIVRRIRKAARYTTRSEFAAAAVCGPDFPKQLGLLEDESPLVVACTSRRAGKTVACAAKLLLRGLARPDSMCLYVTLTRSNAKKLLWKELKGMNTAFALGAEFNESDLSCTLPNGSVIYLSGAKDRKEIEKFRGLSLWCVVIDEAQSFPPHIEDMVDDVIDPCLWDVQGQLVVIGTPGIIKAGYFYELTHSEHIEASRHHWTIRDNPHIAEKAGMSVDEILVRTRKKRGITEDDPSYRREALGQWVTDLQAQAIKYDADRNGHPIERCDLHVIGVDIGMDDADAVVVWGWRHGVKELHLVAEAVVHGQLTDELGATIREMKERYKTIRVVGDSGGGGKKTIADLNARYPMLAIEPADKGPTLIGSVRQFNDDLLAGVIQASPSSTFAAECQLTQWDMKKVQEKRQYAFSDNYHPDAIPASLYAYRAATHYFPAQPKEPDISEAQRHWAEMAKKRQREKRMRERGY